MTVAIGIVCTDGVLVASDSMGSDQQTASFSKKVHAFDRSPVIWTASGSQYVVEEVTEAFQGIDSSGNGAAPLGILSNPNLPLIRKKLNGAANPAMRKAYENALASNPIPAGSTHNSFFTNFLLLGYGSGTPWFLEISGDGQLNWHTEDGFYATGSGGPFATVARGLMSHYLADDLTLEKGKLVAYRAIATTIEVSNSSVGLPVQIAVCDAEGQRILDVEEIESIKVSVDRWKEIERQSLIDVQQGEAADDLPEFEPAS